MVLTPDRVRPGPSSGRVVLFYVICGLFVDSLTRGLPTYAMCLLMSLWF